MANKIDEFTDAEDMPEDMDVYNCLSCHRLVDVEEFAENNGQCNNCALENK